jgi:GTPase SAR1 family protein
MTVAQCKQFLVGLPASGKTTYLAALWHVARSDDVEGAMRLVRMHGEQGYLNKITNLWADAKQLPRTQVGSEQYVSMILGDPKGDSETELVFPDLSSCSSIQTRCLRRI